MELLETKSIGSLGRIVIPRGVRARWDIKPNAKVEIHLDGDSLVLKKAEKQCSLCGETISDGNCVKFNKSPVSVILCDSCYGFLWKKFKEDETKEKIQMHAKKGED